MKKIFIYFATAMMLASCSSEENVADDKNKPIENPFPDYNGVVATMPDVEFVGDDDPQTRASLTYDFNKKIMKSTWTEGDVVGVYPLEDEGVTLPIEQSSQQPWKLDPNTPLVVGESSVTGMFVGADASVQALEANARYISYFPYTTYDGTYDKIPVSYRNQRQDVNVNVNAYYNRNASTQNMDDYLASEPLASAHLGAYDYLVSNAIAHPNGGAHFVYTRLGSIARFFIKVPARNVYDALIFYNSRANFVLDAEMSVAEKKLIPKETGHSMILQLGGNGFDLTNPETNPTSFNGEKGYIIAYLMSAPMVNLKSLEMDPCTLYLLGHMDISEDDYNNLSSSDKLVYEKIGENCYRTKTYYKNSVDLSKFNLEQNKVQQWSPTLGPDKPIEFQSISVQQWKEETGFDNEGKGTETW